MNCYTELRLLDLKGAIDQLPIPSFERSDEPSALPPILPLLQRPLPEAHFITLQLDPENANRETDAEDCVGAGVSSGTPARTRTWDLRFRKPLL